ncbi:hypothetical protein, conserved [Trypanosoma brucei gambiense DAL972]|uniref:Uncharacterized protein n=2 Tax=Trypanosoma brucei TaxID=5691 RepID=C9ZUZ5_TRYB9|nr:hypothetical protein, conserved [Trypanosoma brucei gambiense DAL972]RHW70752.1 hypothetical protein DPX39_080024000 [Trypanosoma brucei equiperdum]CBH13233.1 hypothetical protein, conserved [Trypanosoma brucei gambiense DAL972]|eukprot:XP_011775510.1 hypothetical protein, conserved [Trypanosoma brucei gambiense DAL972]
MTDPFYRLRRRCLFLFDRGAIGEALSKPDMLKRVDAILQQARQSNGVETESTSTAACGAVGTFDELCVCISRWQRRRQFADWEECLEWLLFLQERVQTPEAERDAYRWALREMITLFSEEEREYKDALSEEGVKYWRKTIISMQPHFHFTNSAQAMDVEGREGHHQVSWSIGGELSPLVRQVFLPS